MYTVCVYKWNIALIHQAGDHKLLTFWALTFVF